MKRILSAACIVLICAVLAVVTPSGASVPLAAPPTPQHLSLFATAQNGNAVAYAWRDSGGVFVYNGTQHTYTRPTTQRPSTLALALFDPATPVVAWHDSTGVHASIWNDAGWPGVIVQFWYKTNFGAGRNPQLLTNPLRLVYFDTHGAFTCQQWTGSAWQKGCQA